MAERLDEMGQKLAALTMAMEPAGPGSGASDQDPPSLGRLAGEMGRRLAADIALRTKEPLRGSRRSS